MCSSKRIFSAILSSLLLLSFVACGNQSKESEEGGANSGSSGDVNINLWHIWTVETDAMKIATQEAADSYMAEHENVKININVLENDAYKSKMSTEFAGSAKNIDLFYYWGAGRAGKLVNADKLLPLDDYLDDETRSAIKPGSTQALSYDDKLYALPVYSWKMVLYCNTELFEQASVPLPTTYDELLSASEKLSDAGITPIAQGIKEAWQAAFVYEALALREVGADKVNKTLNGEISFDDPGFLSAAQKTNELYRAGAFGPNPFEVAAPDADTMFNTGKAAMRLTGNWFTEGVEVAKDSVVQGKVTAVEIPMTASQAGKVSDYAGGFVEGFFVNKNTENPQEVIDFSAYLSKKLAAVRHESGQGFTGFTLPVDESKFSDLAKQVADLAAATEDGVLAWDTVLDENTATTHLEAVQLLFSDNPDFDAFIETHKQAFEAMKTN